MNGSLSMRLPPLTEADLQDFGHLMPETVHTLVGSLGPESALALLNTWPGAEIKVPRFAGANPAGARRWTQIAAVVGESAMQVLAAEYGGMPLQVPLCTRARAEKRNRLIRRDFDRFTARPPNGLGLSKAEAVQEVGMRHAPISARKVESILNSAAR